MDSCKLEIRMKYHLLLLALGIGSLVFGAFAADPNRTPTSRAEQLFARATADDFLGDAACADCHPDKSTAFPSSLHAAPMKNSKLPLNQQGCEGCHGAGGIHQSEDNPDVVAFKKWNAKDSSAACLRCHDATLSDAHWKQSGHAKAGLSCVSCHQIHPDSSPTPEKGDVHVSAASNPADVTKIATKSSHGLLIAPEAKLCGQCHAPQLAQFRLTSHHPVPEGQMLCSSCHDAHPSKTMKGRVETDKSACVTCHREQAGPFVFEHDPVSMGTGDGCGECHRPHGSNNPNLLSSFSRGMCAQCHTEKLAAHYPGRTCWTAGCHVAPHGSQTDDKFLQP